MLRHCQVWTHIQFPRVPDMNAGIAAPPPVFYRMCKLCIQQAPLSLHRLSAGRFLDPQPAGSPPRTFASAALAADVSAAACVCRIEAVRCCPLWLFPSADMFAPPDLLVDVPGVAWLGNEAVKLVAPVPENLAEQIGLQYSLEQAVGEFIANNGTVACPDTFSVNLIKGCYSVGEAGLLALVMGAAGGA